MWEEEPKWHKVCLGPGNRPDRKGLGDSGKLDCREVVGKVVVGPEIQLDIIVCILRRHSTF